MPKLGNKKIEKPNISRKVNAILIFFSCLLFSYSMVCQTKNLNKLKGKKIGLVLSGGGAKGFAHIGVLKVLEKAGVKIDYIGGTSMGAVVGGLYASGYSATQIDSIFRTTDFDALLEDYLPRSSKNFYEKHNDESYIITLPFNNFRIGIPTAFSKGMYNYNLLSKLTHNVRYIHDFKKLPIPFVCIATNIEKGEKVVLDHGYLAQAMLASSAFPTLFAPVEIDGLLLVDGGVSDNYPADEVQKMGAEIIIGVDVQDELRDRKTLNDATKILVQISNIQMNEKMRINIKRTNIYIKPDISTFNVVSFAQGREIIKRGEDAAMKVYDEIEKLGTNYVRQQKISNLIDSISVDKISVPELQNYTRAYIIGKLGFKSCSKISYETLKKGIDNLNATQNFSSITYSFEKDNNGDDNLRLELRENPVKTFLRLGLHYDGLYKSGVILNITKKKLLFKNDVASLDLILGDNFRYNFDYYLDNGFYWSFGIKSRYNKFNRNVQTDFKNGSLLTQLDLKTINIDYSELTNQAYFQTIFAQKFLIGIGAEVKKLKIKSETLQSYIPVFENSFYGSLFGYLKFDSFDNKYFPKNGFYINGDFQTYLHSSTKEISNFKQFSIAKADAGIVKTIFNKTVFKFQTEGGFLMGGKDVHFFDFVLGGYGFAPLNNFKPFYGYDFLGIAGNSFIKTTGTVDYEIFRKNHLNLSANFANVKDNLFETADWISKPKYTGYALGYGLESRIGPVEIKYSWSPEVRKSFVWFSVGFWF